jgi:hypothetical protein
METLLLLQMNGFRQASNNQIQKPGAAAGFYAEISTRF